MTQAEILTYLEQNTHGLFTAAFVVKVNEAFGTKIKCNVYSADAPANPKGLTLDNGRSRARGLAAFDLAPILCSQLNVKFESKLGRGFQVRACVEALRAAGYGQ